MSTIFNGHEWGNIMKNTIMPVLFVAASLTGCNLFGIEEVGREVKDKFPSTLTISY